MLRNRRMLFAMTALLALTATAALADISPTTGLETDRPYRPVMVEYSNSAEARPHWNLSEADVVYEAIYWGPSHTRYQALFNDQLPDVAGSIRGARVYGLSLAKSWDCAYAAHGGQESRGTSIYDYAMEYDFLDDMWINGVKNPARMSRVKGIPSPHNVVIDVSAWVDDFWPDDPGTGKPYEPREGGMAFSGTPTTGERKALSLDINYGGPANPSYTYNAAKNLWERYYNGEAQEDGSTKKAIVAANVIVQANDLAFFQNSMARPVMQLVGEGPFAAFIDGTMVEGTWTREGENAPIRYQLEDGSPLLLRPGKTFVQIVPPYMFESMSGQDTAITYTNPKGEAAI